MTTTTHCECLTWTAYNPEKMGLRHHYNCTKYHTEKIPHLMYYCEAVNAWVPVGKDSDTIIGVDDISDGDRVEIQFWRKDMTDAEFKAIPED